MKASTCQHFASYLDDLLDRDDIPRMPQAYRLFWGQTFVALLHRLQTTTIILSPKTPAEIQVTIIFSQTSLKSLCSMKMVAENGTMWLPLASLAGKFGTCTSDWGGKEHQQEGLKYTRLWYSHTNTSDTNLWAFRKVCNCDFEWLQDRHGSGSCFIQKVPHTRLQKMWLRRRLGNCYSNLPKMSCFTTQQYEQMKLQGPSKTLYVPVHRSCW